MKHLVILHVSVHIKFSMEMAVSYLQGSFAVNVVVIYYLLISVLVLVSE